MFALQSLNLPFYGAFRHKKTPRSYIFLMSPTVQHSCEISADAETPRLTTDTGHLGVTAPWTGSLVPMRNSCGVKSVGQLGPFQLRHWEEKLNK